MKAFTRHSSREEVFFMRIEIETRDHQRIQQRKIVVGRDELLNKFAAAVTIPAVRLVEADRDGKILMTFKNEMF